jgi:riboflavin synthase
LFTGIVKSVCSVLEVTEHKEQLKIQVEKPNHPDFSQLKEGDSVAVDGVCLTLEKCLPETMSFHLSYETLKITGWNKEKLKGRKVNLEPALRVGDFIGGHFISGHVDGVVEVLDCTVKGDSVLMKIKVPTEFKNYFWKKAFISLNGVSLTVNEVKDSQLSICLIPETLKRTNLSGQTLGNLLTFEVDSWSRALVSGLKNVRIKQ